MIEFFVPGRAVPGGSKTATLIRRKGGDVVLSPFMGIGSEVYAAVANGRRAIGIELKASYYRQALQNLRSVRDQKIEVETEEPIDTVQDSFAWESDGEEEEEIEALPD